MDAIDTMFLFLAPEVRTTGHHRVERVTAAGPTALVWVPDAETAAQLADEQADDGVRLIELYRGFGLEQAGRVVEAVAGRAPVGMAARTDNGAPGNSVTIFGDDTDTDPVTVEHGDTNTTVIGVRDEDAAVRAAGTAVAAGADTVEICGGTPLTTAAKVAAAIGDRATVTLVSWPFESIDAAAAYKAAFEPAH